MKSRPSVVALAFFVLLLNSGYLYAFADPTLFYFGNIALHVMLEPTPRVVAGQPITSPLSSETATADNAIFPVFVTR